MTQTKRLPAKPRVARRVPTQFQDVQDQELASFLAATRAPTLREVTRDEQFAFLREDTWHPWR